MPKTRLLAMVLGTAMCALGLGYFVQYGHSTPGQSDRPATPPIQQSVLKPQADPIEPIGALELSNMTHTSATRDPAPQMPRMARADLSLATTPGDARILPDAPDAAEDAACSVELSATPAKMASVVLGMSAPCLPNARVNIHHSGMMFTDATDTNGDLTVTVPALSETAVFIVQFGNGNGNVVVADVPELAHYDRVVLQWTGDAGFQLHALENGAGYGENGHVWAGADTRGLGMITTLGNPDTLAPQMAQVYSVPKDSENPDSAIALSVEAEITARNCGRDIAAQTLELRGDATLRPRDLTLSMPDCAARGDFLVLNNLVEDLTIAAK